jgi:hypothetical protein
VGPDVDILKSFTRLWTSVYSYTLSAGAQIFQRMEAAASSLMSLRCSQMLLKENEGCRFLVSTSAASNNPFFYRLRTYFDNPRWRFQYGQHEPFAVG